MKNKTLPNFEFEIACGTEIVIGIDEVGRGAIAGPVVAGAVFIPIRHASEFWLGLGIDDSKRLTAKKREELALIIQTHAVWGIGESSVATINRMGIVKATDKAMRKAVKALRSNVSHDSDDSHFLLIDAFSLKHVPFCGLKFQKAIIKGDQKSISIAAASIIVKVYRDNLMKNLSKKHPEFGWEKNVGYGTKIHTNAIRKNGISKLHRKLFVRNLI